MEERLDPHYFSTTPKNSWELFKWIFTEPIKLVKLSSRLSRKEMMTWSVKVYFFISLLSFIVFLSSNFMVAWLDLPTNYPEFFKKMITESWGKQLSVYTKFVFLLQTLLYGFIFFISFGFVLSSVIGLAGAGLSGSLGVGLTVGLTASLVLGLIGSLSPSLIIGFVYGILFGVVFPFFSTLIWFLIFSSLVSLASGLTFMLSSYFISFGFHTYFYHFILGKILSPDLSKNPYLKDSYVFFSIYGLRKKLANDAFNRVSLALDFTNFLFEFRPYQRQLAFYLLNVVYASKLYSHKLDANTIEIAIDFEKNQPTENFTNTLTQLKNALETYQVQSNVHHQKASLSNVVEILKELEQQMLIEKRGWSEYYLKAIRANLDEADARLKNLELEVKKREPITPNIYNIGNPLSPNYQNELFKGRKDVVDRLSNIIYTSPQMPLLLIQGQRRVGKTSLLNYLEQLLGSGFKIVKLDMQSGTNKRFDTFVQNINQALNEMLGIDESIETGDDILESWNAFEAYLTEHTKALNYKVIIAFDEYESFHKHIVKKHGEDILANMRSFMQSQNQVIFLFSGMLRISDLTSPNWDEYFPNAQRLKVDYLSKEESLELIIKPVDGFNLLYTDDVANEVYALTMGHPQLLQTLCSSIVTLANQTNQKNVSQEMVREAKEEVFEVNEMPMTIFWREFCADAEREVMEQILSHKEILKETREQKRAVARLEDYGFITKEMKIRVPLFEKWLVERRDLIEIEITRDSLRDERLSKYE